jgi:N-acetylglucosamine-6-phosphate deacetylase
VAETNPVTPLLIQDCELVLPDRVVRQGAVLAVGGTILYAGAADRLPAPLPAGCLRVSAGGMLACPSLWETHIHGCVGVSTEKMDPDSLLRMARFLAGRGVGVFMPTAVPDEKHIALLGDALASTADHPEISGRIPGIHVEGPFVAAARRGAIPEALLKAPSADALRELAALSRGRLRMMTFAPELPGAAPLAERMQALGILPSLGHSEARCEELEWCAGISPLNVTHLFNGMSGVSHRDPGLAAWALLNREVFTELNTDGTHVHDAAVHLALRTRPWERIVVISDAVAPAGAPADAALPEMYGKRLAARGSGLFYADSGTLIGSRFLVPDCLQRLVGEFKVPLAPAVAMATLNPARFLGYRCKGALLAGYDADISLFSRDFSRCSLLCWQGRILFQDPGIATAPSSL